MGVTLIYGNDFDTSDSSKLFKYTVDTFSTLSSLVGVTEGDLAYVSNTTGIFGFRNIKGGYEFKGGVWEYGNSELQELAITQQAEIAANDIDIASLQSNKLDKAGYTGNANDLKDYIDKLTWASFITSESPLMNQQAVPNYEPFFGIINPITNVDNTGTWVLPPLPYTGDYEVSLNYRFSYTNIQTNFEAHVLLDGATFIMPLHIEPKDSGGTGQLVPTVANNVLTGLTENTNTDQFIKASGKRFINRTAGDVVTLRLEFAGQNANRRATIYNASLVVRYVDNKNV